MAITASGIGSGLDIESLVTQLVEAEGQPAAIRLATREAEYQADLSAIGVLKSELSNFQTAVQALQEADDFLGRTVSSSDEERFTATSEATAAPGNYQIEVLQLAQAARVRTNDFTSDSEVVGTGTLDISLGSSSFSLTIDSENQTLAGIRDAINNAEDNPGITASLINVDSGTRLIFSSDTIGAANTITIDATDDDGGDGFDLTRLATANLTSVQDAQDAIVLIDQQQVTRSSNTISDAISGVTLSLEQAEVGVVETLTVELDKDGIKDKVNSFVAAYNSVASTLSQLTSFDVDSSTAGQFQGDAGIRGLQNQLRRLISDPVDGLDISTLAQLGVTTDSTGQLIVDSDDLDAAIDSDFTAVSQLFTDEDGLSNQFDDLLDRYVASDGILTSRTDSLQTQISTIEDDREDLELRLDTIEARYRAQFSALDSLVSELNSIGSFLTTQLANLPTINNSSN